MHRLALLQLEPYRPRTYNIGVLSPFYPVGKVFKYLFPALWPISVFTYQEIVNRDEQGEPNEPSIQLGPLTGSQSIGSTTSFAETLARRDRDPQTHRPPTFLESVRLNKKLQKPLRVDTNKAKSLRSSSPAHSPRSVLSVRCESPMSALRSPSSPLAGTPLFRALEEGLSAIVVKSPISTSRTHPRKKQRGFFSVGNIPTKGGRSSPRSPKVYSNNKIDEGFAGDADQGGSEERREGEECWGLLRSPRVGN